MKQLLSYLQDNYQIQSLGDVTWAHAVNSQEKLQRFLADPEIMMLEADIRVSPLGHAVAAHPPEMNSDLSFEELVYAVARSNKGLKLDFKDPEILVPCLTMLQKANLEQPVLLNADILQGNAPQPSKFNAHGFVALCRKIYPEGILSMGWTTFLQPYTKENVDEMLALCADIPQATFPVRVGLLPGSWSHIERLLQKDDYSLTIWNAEQVDEELQTWLRTFTDPTKTCYDLTDRDKNPISIW